MNLYMTTCVWAFIQLSSFPGFHQDMGETMLCQEAGVLHLKHCKKFCLSLNYSGTEIIFYSGLFFRLNKTLLCFTMSAQKQEENFSSSAQISVRKIKSQERTYSQNLKE